MLFGVLRRLSHRQQRDMRSVSALLVAAVIASLGGQAQAADSIASTGQVMTDAVEGLSTGCAGIITSLLQTNFVRCANGLDLLSLAATPANNSIVKPALQNWIEGLDGAPVCSSQDLKKLRSDISSKCSANDQKQASIAGLQQIAANYGTLRDTLTLQPDDDIGDNYCVTTILSAAESASKKPFTVQALNNLMSGNTQAMLSLINSVDTKVYCNDCGKAVITKVASLANSTSGASAKNQIKSTVDQKCGDDFVADNSSAVPSGIVAASKPSDGYQSFGQMHIWAVVVMLLLPLLTLGI